ncbi:MAG: flagellar biosynthesis protein FlgL [Rhizobacter sp.]|nr:flagellar biosynthesis protein FlgL [Rhizobacter sp.]
MRISSTQYQNTMSSALQSAQSNVEMTLEQMASGQKLRLPSDDPGTAVRLGRLSREEASLDQYLSNISAMRTRLQQNETLMDGMVNDVMQARDLMVWASDGANTSDDVKAMSSTVANLRDSLLYSANTKDQEGRYVFSGTATATKAITGVVVNGVEGAPYTFTGNTDEQKVVVGADVTQTTNVNLHDIAALLNQLDAVAKALSPAPATPGGPSPEVSVNDPATRATLKAGLDGLDSALDYLNGKIATQGGAQNTLDTLQSNHENVSLSNKQAALTLGALDYGDAAIKLQSYSTALEATQKAYAKVSGLSLFDVL